jgi:integrase
MLDFATKQRYIAENPASEVKHFNELREKPIRRMLTLDEERRILDAAPVYLRVAIILLPQTGGRTYSEGFSLRWSQVDFENKLIRLTNNVKTPAFYVTSFVLVSVKLLRMLSCSAPCGTQAPKPSATINWEWPTRSETRWINRTNGCTEREQRYILVTVGLQKRRRRKSPSVTN